MAELLEVAWTSYCVTKAWLQKLGYKKLVGRPILAAAAFQAAFALHHRCFSAGPYQQDQSGKYKESKGALRELIGGRDRIH
jgi:hypothetical protein